jgi:hypothetical protein
LIADFVSGLLDHQKYGPVNALNHRFIKINKEIIGNQGSANIVYGKGLSKERDLPKLRLEASVRTCNKNSRQEPTSTYLCLTRTTI